MGLFGWLGRKKPAAVDPIAAFDALLEQLDRQGAQVRRSAAALLASRSELERDQQRHGRQKDELSSRIASASQRADAQAREVLERDQQQLRQRVEETDRALAKVAADAEVLLGLAKELGEQSAALRQERSSARARLDSERIFSDALKQRTARIEQILAVDAARDELERAHALAEIAREDAGLR